MKPSQSSLMVAIAFLIGHAANTEAAEPTPAEIAAISYTGLPDDRGVEAPFAFSLATVKDDYQAAAACADFVILLDAWEPATDPDLKRRLDALLSVLALADLCRKPYESQAPLIVQQRLVAAIPTDRLQALLAGAILMPGRIDVLTDIPTFRMNGFDSVVVRQRAVIYATKIIGRLRGYLPKQR